MPLLITATLIIRIFLARTIKAVTMNLRVRSPQYYIAIIKTVMESIGICDILKKNKIGIFLICYTSYCKKLLKTFENAF